MTANPAQAMIVNQVTKDRATILAPAKVNLFLEVLNRRPDGFHNINSLFQAVSLCDELELEVRPEPGIELVIAGQTDLPADQDNLIARAFTLMQQRFNLDRGLTVRLTKRIPVAAGLGGGSADAAATLLACNELFGLGRSRAELARLSAEIGSDLPFFFSSGQALVTGRGEIVNETSLPVDYWLLLVTPDLQVSTAQAYAALRIGLTTDRIPFSLHGCQTEGELYAALERTGNDFESVHLDKQPVLRRIKQELSERGAILSRMSGSGPTVFGIFDKEPDRSWVRFFCREGWQAEVVRPIFLGGH